MTSIVLGGYISVLTSHIMNMVLPKMMSDLGTDVITIRWVVTSYMIANAVVMPLSAWLARTLGARDLYIRLSVCLYREYRGVWHGYEHSHDRDLSGHSRGQRWPDYARQHAPHA